MQPTWYSDAPPAPIRIGVAGWLRVGLRGVAIVWLLLIGVVLLLALRGIERLVHGPSRPWTPHIARATLHGCLLISGLRLRQRGRMMNAPGAVVANHSSWIDILAINACGPVAFVAKSEVAGWPVIGWLARLSGTLFVARRRTQAAAHLEQIALRLRRGDRLAIFAEGTSTDGTAVLPFKASLFEAFRGPSAPKGLCIQPVGLRYIAPDSVDPRAYGWWGDMSLGPHLAQVLSMARQGRVEVTFCAPINAASVADRKVLARQSRDAIVAALARSG